MRYIRLEGDVAYVELTRGCEAIIDAADAPLIQKFAWHAIPNGVGGFYARSDGTYMHRLIMNTPADRHTDHINHNTLDNRRSNLRICTVKENHANGKWALTTHCPQGHPYDEKNTYLNKKNKRICLACAAIRSREKYHSMTPEQREKRRQAEKERYEKNREARLAKARDYAAAHKAEKHEYDKARWARQKAAR